MRDGNLMLMLGVYIIQAIISPIPIFFAIWYFISARKVGKNPWVWGVAGYFTYFMSMLILMSPLKYFNLGSGLGIVAGNAVVLLMLLVSVIVTVVVRSKILMKVKQETRTLTAGELYFEKKSRNVAVLYNIYFIISIRPFLLLCWRSCGSCSCNYLFVFHHKGYRKF